MQNEFILYEYEEALAMKELGFDEECFMMYNKTKLEESVNVKTFKLHPLDFNNFDALPHCISAPLCQQVFRWFREKYKLFGEVNLTTKQEDIEAFEFFVLNVNEPLFESDDYPTYEEAELACLKKLIEIVNQNKEDEYTRNKRISS